MKYFLIKLICLVLAFTFNSRIFACSSNSDCTSDPAGPTCIDGVCDSCCNAPVSNETECLAVADSCVFNEDYMTCQDNGSTLCEGSGIPETPVSSASRWLWLPIAGALVGGALFLRRKRATRPS